MSGVLEGCTGFEAANSKLGAAAEILVGILVTADCFAADKINLEFFGSVVDTAGETSAVVMPVEDTELLVTGGTASGSIVPSNNTADSVVGREDSIAVGDVFTSSGRSLTTAQLRATFARGDFFGSGSFKMEEMVR